MYLYIYMVVTYLIVTASSINGKPTNEFLNSLISLKCPYLLSDVLPKYVKECNVSIKEDSIKLIEILNDNNKNDALCVMYYTAFKNICNLTRNESEPVKEAINNLMKNNLRTFQQQNNVCLNLKKPVMETVKKDLSTSLCTHICIDYSDNVKPICSAIALMYNITEILLTKKLVIKPVIVEPLAHGEDTSHKIKGAKVDQHKFLPSVAKKVLVGYEDIANDKLLAENKKTDEEHEVTSHNLQQEDSVTSGKNMAVSAVQIQFQPNKETSDDKEHVNADKNLTNNHTANNLTAVVPDTGKQHSANEKVENEAEQAITNTKVTDVSQVISTVNDKKVKMEENKLIMNVVDQENNRPKLENQKNDDVVETKPISGTNDNGKVEDKQPSKTINIEPVDVDIQNVPEQLGNDETEDFDMVGEGNEGMENNNPNEIQPKSSEVKSKFVEKSKPLEIDEDSSSLAANFQNQNIDDSESYFFSYFMMVCIMFICGYVAYHNKQKILALVVEGRKGRRQSRTRRPNSANYRKLDSNLEEAVTSACNKSATQVIY